MGGSTHTDALGEVLRMDGRVGLRFVRRYAHPIERVWAAITESEHIRAWLPCDMIGERRAGADILLPFGAAQVQKYDMAEPAISGRIEVWEPPAVFQWFWGGDLLRFELTETDGGTTLRFTTWLEQSDPALLVATASGYHLCLGELRSLLDRGRTTPLTEQDHQVRALEAEYAARV
ncbi:MAG TPA: SRPBCC domain-containing protein [Microlunatus sp.]|nr:SRPBCC domain-containing protein [Microlunatus sp.]